MDLAFEHDRQPLAARMRPRTIDEFVGQDHIVGPGRLLRRAIEVDQLQSIILSGPPGTGKTTLARVIAERTRSQFLSINAVLSGVKDIRNAIEQARDYLDRTNRRTLLFVDEVHRWNKSQQDALLPWVENGLLVLIGATTENPFFEVNRALLSRSRVFLLTPLTDSDLERIVSMTLADRERGYGAYDVTITPEARDHLIATASGDARTLLNALELAVETTAERFPPPGGTTILVTLEIAEDSIQRRAVLYDKDGDYHFDTISAFIKSVRGSDPDAALYWLARMVTAGEDPRYILRRLLILAAEDIGLADPDAVSVVNSCAAAFDRVGMPEGQFHLAEATLYCAAAAKSNSTLGYFDALKAVQEVHGDEVPDHLRDASRDGADLGHGRDYLYPHAYRDHWVAQQYLPDTLQGQLFYQPGSQGWEDRQRQLLEQRRRIQMAIEREQAFSVYATKPSYSRTERWLQRVDNGVIEEATSFRDQVLKRLAITATDRVLLCGAPLQLFVWETMRRTAGGLTAVWCSDTADIEALDHLLERSPLQGVERPQTAGPTRPGQLPVENGVYSGPFDRILCRPAPGRDSSGEEPGLLLDRLVTRCASNGRILILELLPQEGTRPSIVLTLSEELRVALAAAENYLFPTREDSWRDALVSAELWDATTVSRLRTSVSRSVSGALARSWFAEDEPLSSAVVSTAGTKVLESIRSASGEWAGGEILWQRTFLTLTIDLSRS